MLPKSKLSLSAAQGQGHLWSMGSSASKEPTNLPKWLFRCFGWPTPGAETNPYFDVETLLASVESGAIAAVKGTWLCLLYTSPSPRDRQKSRMPSSA